jgi:hypothetical protein
MKFKLVITLANNNANRVNCREYGEKKRKKERRAKTKHEQKLLV